MGSNQLIVIYKGLVWHRITQSGVITPPLCVKVMNILYQPQEMIQTAICGAYIVSVCACMCAYVYSSMYCTCGVFQGAAQFMWWTLEPTLVCSADK